MPDKPNYGGRYGDHDPNDDWRFIDEFTYSADTLCKIAPPMTKSMEQLPHMISFRKNLKNGDKCDVVDSVYMWYSGTVVDTDDSKNPIMIHYDGWHNKYDEWIERDSPRLQHSESDFNFMHKQVMC